MSRNESLDEQITAHMQTRDLGRQLAKEHEWCDKEIASLRTRLSAATAALEAAEQAMMDHRGALVRVVMEGNGCGKHCSLEFHQWAIESMLKIAGDSLKRFAKPLSDPPAIDAERSKT